MLPETSVAVPMVQGVAFAVMDGQKLLSPACWVNVAPVMVAAPLASTWIVNAEWHGTFWPMYERVVGPAEVVLVLFSGP